MTYLNAKKFVSGASEQKNPDRNALAKILDRLGTPHRRLKYILLAGSNGKTVCAEMLCSVLKSAEYTVGCLRLPLREEPRENICVGDECISMSDFSVYISTIREQCIRDGITLTRSELLLAVAMLAFKKAGCHLCLLECGDLADTLISLPPPLAAVICGTIPSGNQEEIAKIRSYIRRGIEEIVSAPQDGDAYKFIFDTCVHVGCRPPTIPSKNAQSVQRLNFRGSEFTYKNVSYTLKLCGRFQISNAILVLETLEMLGRHGYRISHDAVRKGLSTLKIPSKFEVVSISPLMIVDSTHSPVAINTVCGSLSDFKECAGKRIILCLPEDKIIDRYCDALAANGFGVSKIFTLSAAEPAAFAEYTAPICVCKNPRTLVKSVLSELSDDTVLLISGQHSFVTPVRYELLATLGF